MLSMIEKLSMLRGVPISCGIGMRPLGIRAPSGLGHSLGLRGATHSRDGICCGIIEFGLRFVRRYRFLRGGYCEHASELAGVWFMSR